MELCVRCSKNISELNGSGVVLCLRSRCSQTGSPTARAPAARNQGVRNPIYSILLAHCQIFAQAFVERPAGIHQKVIQAGDARLRFEPVDVRVDLLPYSFRAYSGETSSDCGGVFHVDQQHGLAELRLDLLRIEHVKQDHLIAAVAQRLDGLDDDVSGSS